RSLHTRFSRDWSSDVCSSDLRFPLCKNDRTSNPFWLIPLTLLFGQIDSKHHGKPVCPFLFCTYPPSGYTVLSPSCLLFRSLFSVFPLRLGLWGRHLNRPLL